MPALINQPIPIHPFRKARVCQLRSYAEAYGAIADAYAKLRVAANGAMDRAEARKADKQSDTHLALAVKFENLANETEAKGD